MSLLIDKIAGPLMHDHAGLKRIIHLPLYTLTAGDIASGYLTLISVLASTYVAPFWLFLDGVQQMEGTGKDFFIVTWTDPGTGLSYIQIRWMAPLGLSSILAAGDILDMYYASNY